MRVAFRADASLSIGSGHVMRCLTLAEALVADGHEVFFVIRQHPGNLAAEIARRGLPLALLAPPVDVAADEAGPLRHAPWLGCGWQDDARETAAALAANPCPFDWLVVDHYALDERWQHHLRPTVRRIMVIDDIADRRHDCDLLLDQNLYADMQQRYAGLLAPSCRTLLGPAYTLLRPEFQQRRTSLPTRDGRVRRLLVTFGGVDAGNETARCIAVLDRIARTDIGVDVVVGGSNPHRHELEVMCRQRANYRFHCQTSEMAALIAAADLGIGAGGATCWERCCLGLPTLLISLAENQTPIAGALAAAGAAEFLGASAAVGTAMIETSLRALLADPRRLTELSQRCHELVDGAGTARVVQAMRSHDLEMK